MSRLPRPVSISLKILLSIGVIAYLVWQINIGHSSSTAPITYMVGGKQYIALGGTTGVVAYTLR